MFSHIHLGTSDFARAVDFYTPLMAELGLVLKFCDPAREWAGWQRPDAARPLFLIGRPYDRGAARPGNGPMTAFLAEDRATVDRVHALALSLGGQDDGAPGLRPHYHPDYYGAYFRDPDGNKICVCCHQAASEDAA